MTKAGKLEVAFNPEGKIVTPCEAQKLYHKLEDDLIYNEVQYEKSHEKSHQNESETGLERI